MGHEPCPWSSRKPREPNDRWSPFPEGAVASCDVETRLPWPYMDLRSLGGSWLNRLPPEAAAASNWRRGKTRLTAKKRRLHRESVCILIHLQARHRSPANACEAARRRVKLPRRTDSRESDDAIRPLHYALAPAGARPV